MRSYLFFNDRIAVKFIVIDSVFIIQNNKTEPINLSLQKVTLKHA